MTYIYIFSIIGLLILIIAAINYINLSTARASIRIKEIGIRKVTGSNKIQLVKLFLTDSVLISLLATTIAIIVIIAVMPWYNQFTGKDIQLWHFGVTRTLTIVLIFSLISGIISGIYPALFLSGFRLIPALKGQTGTHTGNVLFRKSLVTFQFVITICMISASLVIYQQLKYVLGKDLGFNKDQLLGFHLQSEDARKKIPVLKRQLLNSPFVESVAATGLHIGNNRTWMIGYRIKAIKRSEEKVRSTHILTIDEDYIPTLKLPMAAGRNYSKQLATDKTSSIIVNETLVRDAGLKDPVGKKIVVDETPYTVIGVVKDFHFSSLQKKIEPLVLTLPPEQAENDNLYVRIKKNNIPAALKFIEQTYQQFDSGSPFLYTFLDEDFAKQYETEKKQRDILLGFTVLSVLIACLGLFGLVTFMVEQRVKEIGIRKVLGASVGSLVKLLSVDFIKLVLIASLIAFPIAWWALQSWLEDFAYRIELDGTIFLVASFSAILVAMITISIQSVKAAIANPVKNLRVD
jgi:putative ABC transport system permease protein